MATTAIAHAMWGWDARRIAAKYGITEGKVAGPRCHTYADRLDAAGDRRFLVGVIMASKSDWEAMKAAAETLDRFGVACERRVVSAHRTPEWMAEYAAAKERSLEVIIADAGGAAHLPGMVAGHTLLPVIGVPIQSRALSGRDSLLSIARMPAGILFPIP